MNKLNPIARQSPTVDPKTVEALLGVGLSVARSGVGEVVEFEVAFAVGLAVDFSLGLAVGLAVGLVVGLVDGLDVAITVAVGAEVGFRPGFGRSRTSSTCSVVIFETLNGGG